ncbi:MAG TPA: hypothetical protein VIV61_13510 [Candidatus Ozemobacteraceae bacterium]
MLRGFSRVLCVTGLVVLCTGCRDSGTPGATPLSARQATAPASITVSEPARAVTTGTAAIARTLESAHQEYLAAYDRYVKLLRESGPQTMETLGALAEYQRKYQTYQMLLGTSRQAR